MGDNVSEYEISITNISILVWVKIKYATSVALKVHSRSFFAFLFHRLFLTVLDASVKALSSAIEITRFGVVLAKLPAIE